MNAMDRRTRSVGVALLFATIAVVASADDLLVIDRDAHFASSDIGGALFSFDPSAPANTAPAILAAADRGAPFAMPLAVDVSPLDGHALVTDLPWMADPAIYRFDCTTNAATTAATDPRFVAPLAIAFLPDGRAVVADADADPSRLGPDSFGGAGHGALFLVDMRSCTAGCPVSVLSDGRLHPFGGSGSAFEDPRAVAYDRSRDRLVVGDSNASPRGWISSVFAVDIATGAVSLISTNSSWNPIAVNLRPFSDSSSTRSKAGPETRRPVPGPGARTCFSTSPATSCCPDSSFRA